MYRMVIDENEVNECSSGLVNAYSMFASDIGMDPGFMPEKIQLNLNDGRIAKLMIAKVDPGNYYVYAGFGTPSYRLTIFND